MKAAFYIVDPLPVTWTISVTPPPAPSQKPVYTREPGEVFDHLENGNVPYRWDSFTTLQGKQHKFYHRLLRCVEKSQAKGAACAARHLFRIARAMERKGRAWK